MTRPSLVCDPDVGAASVVVARGGLASDLLSLASQSRVYVRGRALRGTDPVAGAVSSAAHAGATWNASMSVLSAAWDLLALHPALAYGAVFILAFSESIPVVGAVVPGTAAILAISALVPSGAVGIWPILSAATAGAVLSDGASYWLGHVYHRGLLDRWPLDRCPGLVARSEGFFHRHGAMSVALARFVPGVRAFVPLVAGIVRMPVARFYAANVVSAVAWAVVHVVPGVAVGDYLHSAHASADRLIVPSLVVAGLLWAIVALSRRASRQRESTP